MNQKQLKALIAAGVFSTALMAGSAYADDAAGGLDLGFVEDARKRFLSESAYLDDRPGVPMRFLVEANLTQIIRRQEQHVDPSESRAQLNDLIKDIFKGQVFEAVSFPGGPYDVPDEVGDGRPVVVEE